MENSKNPSPEPAGSPSAEGFVLEYPRAPARGNTPFPVTLAEIGDECAARGGEAFESGSYTPSGVVEALVAKGALIPLVEGARVHHPAGAPEPPTSAPTQPDAASERSNAAGAADDEDSIPFGVDDDPCLCPPGNEGYFIFDEDGIPPFDPPGDEEILAAREMEEIAHWSKVAEKPVDWVDEPASWFGGIMMRLDRTRFDQSFADRAARTLRDMPRDEWQSLEKAGVINTANVMIMLKGWGSLGEIDD